MFSDDFLLPGHPTVMYLTYPHGDRLHLLDLAHPPQPASFPRGSDFCFLLNEFQNAALFLFWKPFILAAKWKPFVTPWEILL